jgi:hypothetical protein
MPVYTFSTEQAESLPLQFRAKLTPSNILTTVHSRQMSLQLVSVATDELSKLQPLS